MRGIAILAFGLALAGCATKSDPLWPGPDWLSSHTGSSAAPEADAGRSDVGAVGDDATRVPRDRTRRGSSTPPDQLTPPEQRRPQVVQPTAPPVPQQVEPRNDVLAPRDPYKPYSADGGGYQRQGNTIVGPTGETYNRVGSSLIGPGGRACSVVGSSVMC